MDDDKVAKSNELERRLVQFASMTVKLAERLTSIEARHIGQQLLRSGTAAAANYAEARGAGTRADFIHKLSIVGKELNETRVWLKLLSECSLVKPELLAGILEENHQLCRIIAAGLRTARSRG